jgi:hypothetical protein
VILQPTGQAMTADQIMTATFDLGNSSSVRKRVTVLLHDLDFSDLSACTFWMEAGQPLSPYTIQAFATRPWTNATLSVYPATVDTESWMRLDNASFKRTSGASIPGTNCLEPGSAPGAASGPGQSSAAPPSTPAPAQGPMPAASSAAPGSSGVPNAGVALPVLASDTPTDLGNRLQPFDLRDARATHLRFQSWLASAGSRASVQVSVDELSWRTVFDVPVLDLWTACDVDLTPFAGQVIYVRFAFGGVAASGDMDASGVWRIGSVWMDDGWLTTAADLPRPVGPPGQSRR